MVSDKPPVFNPFKMVMFTMRLPKFMKEAIRAEAHRRVSRLQPIPQDAPILREAVKEWMEKRGIWPEGME